MYQLGVHLLFIRFPDAVHWQEKRSVRKSAHCAAHSMPDEQKWQTASHSPRRIDEGKDNGDESSQTIVTQDSVARDHRCCDDAVLDAVLQRAGSEPGAFHANGRRRRLPGAEAAAKEVRESTDRKQLHSGRTLEPCSRSKEECPSSRSQAGSGSRARYLKNWFAQLPVRTVA